MELLVIECCNCKTTFLTGNETGEHKCPKCKISNERYMFDEDTTEEELELINAIYKDIKDVFTSYGIENVSSIKILDLITGK